jgi:hypothetical protein
MNKLVSLAAVALLITATAIQAKAECPFNEALDFHVVQALKANGVTEEQFEALAAAGEFAGGGKISGTCVAEINYAAANPDAYCQALNGKVTSLLMTYSAVAAILFSVTGDARTYRNNLRSILGNYLNFAPHQCWFQGVTMPDPQQPQSATPQQCAQLRANFDACKQQAEGALRQCAGGPHIRNCTNLGPTCAPPPC